MQMKFEKKITRHTTANTNDDKERNQSTSSDQSFSNNIDKPGESTQQLVMEKLVKFELRFNGFFDDDSKVLTRKDTTGATVLDQQKQKNKMKNDILGVLHDGERDENNLLGLLEASEEALDSA